MEKMIMNTTNTLHQLQQTNRSWKSRVWVVFSSLIVILSLQACLHCFQTEPDYSIPAAAGDLVILVLAAIVSNLMYRRQDRIFKIYHPGNAKESLRETITSFENFYTFYNLVNLIVFPSFFYALFQLSLNFLKMTQAEILFTSLLLSLISFAFSHVYYKLTYFRKIKSLKRDLEELKRDG